MGELSPMAAPEVPTAIDGGSVPQVLVRYLGERLGTIGSRGRRSTRSYRYSANEPLFWVHEEDAAWFRSAVEFTVMEESRIDPVTDQRLRLREQMRQEMQEIAASAIASASPPAHRSGRPATPLMTLQRVWHLKNHADQVLSNTQIAEKVFGPRFDESPNPGNLVSKMLARARRVLPDRDNKCPIC